MSYERLGLLFKKVMHVKNICRTREKKSIVFPMAQGAAYKNAHHFWHNFSYYFTWCDPYLFEVLALKMEVSDWLLKIF